MKSVSRQVAFPHWPPQHVPRDFSATLDFTSDHFPAGALAGRGAAICGSRRAAPRTTWRCSGYRPPELVSFARQCPWARHDPALVAEGALIHELVFSLGFLIFVARARLTRRATCPRLLDEEGHCNGVGSIAFYVRPTSPGAARKEAYRRQYHRMGHSHAPRNGRVAADPCRHGVRHHHSPRGGGGTRGVMTTTTRRRPNRQPTPQLAHPGNPEIVHKPTNQPTLGGGGDHVGVFWRTVVAS